MKRSIPSLDGMRGVAVLLVISAHLGIVDRLRHMCEQRHLQWMRKLFEIDAGDLGVSIFFVISGFLITTLILRGAEGRGSGMLRTFYLRRFFRIFPPYYTYLAIVAALWTCNVVPLSWGGFLSSLTYTSNYYPYTSSHPESYGWLVGHTWSLSLEEQFYIFWPVCLYLFSVRSAFWIGMFILGASPFLRIATLGIHPSFAFDGQITRMFHTRMDTIMFGCVLALLNTYPSAKKLLAQAVSRKYPALIAAILLFADLHLSYLSQRINLAFGLSAEGMLLAFLLFYSISNPSSIAGRILNNRALMHIGLISYSLYLWQQLFDGPVRIVPERHGLLLIWIFGCAELSYHFVEKQSTGARDFLLLRLSRRKVLVQTT